MFSLLNMARQGGIKYGLELLMFCCQFYLCLSLQRWAEMMKELLLCCPPGEAAFVRWIVRSEWFQWLPCDPSVSKQHSALQLYHQKPKREDDSRCSAPPSLAKTQGLHCCNVREDEAQHTAVCSLIPVTATLPHSYLAEFLRGKGTTWRRYKECQDPAFVRE